MIWELTFGPYRFFLRTWGWHAALEGLLIICFAVIVYLPRPVTVDSKSNEIQYTNSADNAMKFIA